MQLIFKDYYQRYGIRTLAHIMNPRIFPRDLFTFPKDTSFHFCPDNAEQQFPDQNIKFFKDQTKRIATEHVTELTTDLGHVRRISLSAITVCRPFHLKTPIFRLTQDAASVTKDVTQLILYNYGLLNTFYRYPPNPMQPYYQWANVQNTLFDNINTQAPKSSRNQFIFIDVPSQLIGASMLKQYSKPTTMTTVKIFDTHEKLMLLEFWRWLSDDFRKDSVFNRIAKDQLSKVNVVLWNKDNWSVLNLGVLDSMRAEPGKVKTPGQPMFEPAQLQKYFLTMLIRVGATAAPDEAVVEETTEQDPKKGENDLGEVADDVDDAIVSDTEVIQQQTDQETTPVVNKVTIDDNHLGDDDETDISSMQNQVDADLAALDKMTVKDLKNKGIRENGEEVVVHNKEINEYSDDEMKQTFESVFKVSTPEEELKNQIESQSDYNLMSAAEYRNLMKQADNYANSKNPYKMGDSTITEFVNISEEELSIRSERTKFADDQYVTDKSMLESTVHEFDAKYVNAVLPKHIVSCVSNIQRAGVIVQDYQIEQVDSILGEHEIHTIKLKPIDGASSVIRFKIPKVSTDGEYVNNGNKYKMRKQVVDRPLRKIDATTVALTSYYGKTFVKRCEYKVADVYRWMADHINYMANDETNSLVKEIGPANVFDNYFKAPKAYSGLAHYFKTIDIDGFHFVFDHKQRLEYFKAPEPGIKDLTQEAQANVVEEDGKYRIIGVDRKKQFVLMDYDDQIFIKKADGQVEPIGDMFSLLGLDQAEAPVDFAEIKIFGKNVPIGIVLGYYIGLDKLIQLLKLKPAVYGARERVTLAPHEYAVIFKDKKFVVSRKDKLASLIFGGFIAYKKSIKNYFLETFSNKAVYLNILEAQGVPGRYIKEIDLIEKLFIDPITRQVLEQMKEPTTWVPLLIRSTEMLLLDAHPDSQDMQFMRIRGYERFAGAVYKELVIATRNYNSRNIRGKSKIEMSPYAVSKNIAEDASVKLVEDINPIQNLKEMEAVTFVGEGGRSKDAFVKTARAYHRTNMGVISEATVDSSDVGVNIFTSANPKFTNLYGMTENNFDLAKDGTSALMSTSAMVSPGALHDDPKRVNFISIQQGHTVACAGYRQSQIRTGYERVLPHRTTSMFAYTAKDDGKVISKNDHGIIIEYPNGERKGIQLGRLHGKAEGSVYPFDIVSPLQTDDSFKKGDVICYNTGFFEPDMLNPKQVVWKSAMMVTTLLAETSQTFEDSSSISRELSAKMTTKTTKVRSFVVNFKQGVKEPKLPGDKVALTDYLMIIEDEVTSGTDIFDESTIQALKKFQNMAPKAKYTGVIDAVEVYYNGSKEDMSPSLRSLANKSDKVMADKFKAVGRDISNGKVNEEYRVAGNPLQVDTAEIKIYITVETQASVGDKGVFANQMKSVIGEVIDYDLRTESGEKIDAVFGYQSISARIVLSPDIIGTSASLLDVIAKKAVEIYEK